MDSEPLSALIRDVHVLGEAEAASFARVAARVELLRGEGRLAEALRLLREWLTHHPLSQHGFQLLGDLYECGDHLGESVVAYERALQVDALKLQKEPAPGPWNIRDRIHYGRFPERALRLNGQIFPRLLAAGSREKPLLVGRNLEGTIFVRIDLSPGGLRAAGWEHEQTILRHLHAGTGTQSRAGGGADSVVEQAEPASCISAPAAHGTGRLAFADVLAAVQHDAELMACLPADKADMPYTLTTYLRRDPTPTYGDIVLSLFEQRSLGVYIGKLDSRDLRYDAQTGICSLVDYTQAIMVPEPVSTLRGFDFLQWVRHQEEQRHSWNVGQERPRHYLFGVLHGGPVNAEITAMFQGNLLDHRYTRLMVKDLREVWPNAVRLGLVKEDMLEVPS